MSKRDHQQIIDRINATPGWSARLRASGHYEIRGPNQAIYYTSGTPSDWRASLNLIATLKRMGWEDPRDRPREIREYVPEKRESMPEPERRMIAAPTPAPEKEMTMSNGTLNGATTPKPNTPKAPLNLRTKEGLRAWAEALDRLRTEKDISLADLGTKIGLSRTAAQNWTCGRNPPSVDVVARVHKLLPGMPEVDTSTLNATKRQPEHFGWKLKTAREEHKLTCADVDRLLSISSGYCSTLEKGKSKPSRQVYLKLVDLFPELNGYFDTATLRNFTAHDSRPMPPKPEAAPTSTPAPVAPAVRGTGATVALAIMGAQLLGDRSAWDRCKRLVAKAADLAMSARDLADVMTEIEGSV